MNSTDQTPDPNALDIELSETMAEGEYANLAMIAHSNSKFGKAAR